MILKQYIGKASYVQSWMDVFHVDKTELNICMIYNVTSSGLNEVVWAPNFWLPTSCTAAQSLSYNYCSMDKDLGEMFLNFPLPKRFQIVSGVNLKDLKNQLRYKDMTEREILFGKIGKNKFHTHWTRYWMGFRCSPFYTAMFYYLAEKFIRGKRQDSYNFLR